MFELLFNHPPEAFRRGELVLQPMWSTQSGSLAVDAALASLAVAAVVGLVLVLVLLRARANRPVAAQPRRRRVILRALQAAFVGGVLVLLAGPALQVSTLASGANAVAVLVDVSESMSFPSAAPGRSRLEVGDALVQQLLPELRRNGDVATFTVGSTVRPGDLATLVAGAPETRLIGGLANVLEGFSGTPLAAVVVISDGADTDGGDTDAAMTRLAAAGVPVHAVGVGPLELPGEVRLAAVDLPDHVPPGSRILAELLLVHSSGGPLAVKVYDGPRLIAAEQHELRAGPAAQRIAVAFDSGPGGLRELGFVVEPPPGDLLAANNRQDRLLTVGERRRRVLYLEGEPRWEYKFLRQALAGDDMLTLTSWLRTTGRKTYRQGVEAASELADGFPASRAALYRYDVIVLGSLGAAWLDDTQHRWLEAFVAERGGSLLALAGREALADGGWDVVPLAAALPVTLRRAASAAYGAVDARVQVAAAGRRSPVTQLPGGEGPDPWSALPPIGDYQRLGPMKPAAVTLLEALFEDRTRPLLVIQPYGAGTAGVLATASTWRWRMGTAPGDTRHTLFWRQLLRHLGELARQPKDLAVSAEGDRVLIRLTARDETFSPRAGLQADAKVMGPGTDGLRIPLVPGGAPGVVEGEFRAPASGVYRVDATVAGEAQPETRFVMVGDRAGEATEPGQNRALLERVAEVTGGRYWQPGEAAGIAAAVTFGGAGLRRIEHLPLWSMPALWLVLLCLKGGEWLLRRRWGLL